MTAHEIKFQSSLELFLVRDQIVATQQSYRFEFVRESFCEARHFYCPKCGKVWGMRINADRATNWHKFFASDCKSCGGKEDMLTDFEWGNLEILSESVMAYTILNQEQKDAREN